MNRREAIAKVAWIVGGAVIGAELFMNTGCNSSQNSNDGLFNTDEISLLDEIAETILPETSTPGAKAAGVGAFMAVMVKDCYSKEDQKVFTKGLSTLEDSFKEQYGQTFMNSDKIKRTAFLTALDTEQKKFSMAKKPEEPNHYFGMMKQLTLLGFFTSEIGATQALRYLPVPGKYDGCIPYNKGDRAWAL
ncbi:gluconate 2-dehydrogenase subunit 3 family protein [Arcticibacter sp.]|jgi:hypothetical protein|uniref:gluconate 2-dehydrogenase subunit 3 family protein n=1 Tax=Arcticibacter sp. TaxID=1872630 RepID=UPI0038905E67